MTSAIQESALAANKPYQRIMAGGSMIEAVGGLGAIVLTCLGLAGVLPTYLAAIAILGIGAALMSEGAAMGTRFSRLLVATGSTNLGFAELGGGMTAEFLGGVAGVVLGLLTLLNVAVAVLPAVAVIVFGGVLLLSSGATARLNYLEIKSHSSHERWEIIAHEAVSAAAGGQVLTGLAAVILGILSVVGIARLPLALVALLCIGISVMFSGSAITSRVMKLLGA